MKIIRFVKGRGAYVTGDLAGFEPHIADSLIRQGYAVAAESTGKAAVVNRKIDTGASVGLQAEVAGLDKDVVAPAAADAGTDAEVSGDGATASAEATAEAAPRTRRRRKKTTE